METRPAFPGAKMFPSREQLQYSHLPRPRVGINNINDVLVRSAITLTGSLSADSEGDELPFLSSLTSCGISTMTSVETAGIDEVSNEVDFDSLVRNTRHCLQIAGNNKIKTINRQKHARSKTKNDVDKLKKN